LDLPARGIRLSAHLDGGCGSANNTWTPVNDLPVMAFAVFKSRGG
jgi:hypothetical protein